jgi:hypothetical protein
MPVYEIVLQQPSGIDRVRYGEHLPTEIGDGLTIDDAPWVVIAKEPPFEQRRIERLVCSPRLTLHTDESRAKARTGHPDLTGRS